MDSNNPLATRVAYLRMELDMAARMVRKEFLK
jgi:hypothetical protein